MEETKKKGIRKRKNHLQFPLSDDEQSPPKSSIHNNGRRRKDSEREDEIVVKRGQKRKNMMEEDLVGSEDESNEMCTKRSKSSNWTLSPKKYSQRKQQRSRKMKEESESEEELTSEEEEDENEKKKRKKEVIKEVNMKSKISCCKKNEVRKGEPRKISKKIEEALDPDEEEDARYYRQLEPELEQIERVKDNYQHTILKYKEYQMTEGLSKWRTSLLWGKAKKRVSLMKEHIKVIPTMLRYSKEPPMKVKDQNGRTVGVPCGKIVTLALNCLPRMNYFTHVEQSFNVEDQRTLSHIPYVGEEDHDEIAFTDALVKHYDEGIHGTRNNWGPMINDRILFEVLHPLIVEAKEKNEDNLVPLYHAAIHKLFPNKCSARQLVNKYIDLVDRLSEAPSLPLSAPTRRIPNRPTTLKKGEEEWKRPTRPNNLAFVDKYSTTGAMCTRCCYMNCHVHDEDQLIPTHRDIKEDKDVDLLCGFYCHYKWKERMEHRIEELQCLKEGRPLPPQMILKKETKRRKKKEKTVEKKEENVKGREGLRVRKKQEMKRDGEKDKENENGEKMEEQQEQPSSSKELTPIEEEVNGKEDEGKDKEERDDEIMEEGIEDQQEEGHNRIQEDEKKNGEVDEKKELTSQPALVTNLVKKVVEKKRKKKSQKKKFMKPPEDWENPVLPTPFWSEKEETLFKYLVNEANQNVCDAVGVLQSFWLLEPTKRRECYQVYNYAVSKGLWDPTQPQKRKKIQGRDIYRQFRANAWKNKGEDAGVVENSYKVAACCHSGPCGPTALPFCRCFQKDVPCSKLCPCPIDCKLRFPGCRCQPGACRTKQCQCYYASHECDPDVCTTCNCDVMIKSHDDPQLIVVGTKMCQNVQIQRGVQRKLLIGPSMIAGWGAFLGENVKTGDLISEYVGEVISNREAERRGCMYDKLKLSYIFSLNKDQLVDATRAGNLARFLNHSHYPNCSTRVYVVNGDHRIGIFARRNINKGEELFFNYGYSRLHCQNFISRERAKELILDPCDIKRGEKKGGGDDDDGDMFTQSGFDDRRPKKKKPAKRPKRK